VLSPDIAHKSDSGGVVLNLTTLQEVAESFDVLNDRMRKAYPLAHLQGVLVQPMITGGVECILGAQRDPIFGPLVVFGIGGIYVELLRDVSLRVAPVSEQEALQMINQVKGAPILYGLRGQPGVDLAALCAAIANLSRLAFEQQNFIESIDINPLIALPTGVVGVDALIHVNPQDAH
jgi:hypothetical protein